MCGTVVVPDRKSKPWWHRESIQGGHPVRIQKGRRPAPRLPAALSQQRLSSDRRRARDERGGGDTVGGPLQVHGRIDPVHYRVDRGDSASAAGECRLEGCLLSQHRRRRGLLRFRHGERASGAVEAGTLAQEKWGDCTCYVATSSLEADVPCVRSMYVAVSELHMCCPAFVFPRGSVSTTIGGENQGGTWCWDRGVVCCHSTNVGCRTLLSVASCTHARGECRWRLKTAGELHCCTGSERQSAVGVAPKKRRRSCT